MVSRAQLTLLPVDQGRDSLPRRTTRESSLVGGAQRGDSPANVEPTVSRLTRKRMFKTGLVLALSVVSLILFRRKLF